MRNLVLKTFTALSVLVYSGLGHSEIVFEGYYKLLLGESQAGYAIQRYSFDAEKDQFESIYFIQTNQLLGEAQESLKAVATKEFKPISYQYTSKTGGVIRLIDAGFKENSMIAKIRDGKEKKTNTVKLPKGSFLSTFLGYLMLQKGYEVGKKYSYKAIAEEDAQLHKGQSMIKETLEYKKKNVFRILNEFKNAKFVSWVSRRGEVLKTLSPAQKISTELVASAKDATEGFRLPEKSLRILFGRVPLGKKNILNTQTSTPSNSAIKSSKGKTQKPPKKSKPQGQ